VDQLKRPVFFGQTGIPTLRYEIDAYHPEWTWGLEVEAGRGWMGNAVYSDLVQAAVVVGVEYLSLAVANVYRYRSSDKPAETTPTHCRWPKLFTGTVGYAFHTVSC
jgi:hypothetical protein